MNARKGRILLGSVAVVILLLLVACPQDPFDAEINVSLHVGGYSSDVDIVYVDASGVTQEVIGFDLSATEDGWWEGGDRYPRGTTVDLRVEEHTGSWAIVQVRCGDPGLVVDTWGELVDVDYPLVDQPPTDKLTVTYRITGAGTDLSVTFVDENGESQSVANYNMTSNANKWQYSFDANAGSEFSFTGADHSSQSLVFDVLIDGTTIVTVENGSDGTISGLVPDRF